MTPTRKERIEQIATTLLAALAPTLGNSDIAWAEARRNVAIQAKFLSEQIDALPATEPATARVPDTTTVERERCAAVAKRHLCISGNKFAQDVARSILSEIINPDHVVGSDRKPDHIPDAGQKVEPKVSPGEVVYYDDNGDLVNKKGEQLDAGEKVALPGKWAAKDQWISFPDGRDLAAPNEYVADVVCKKHNADLDAAREYWFRAGIEAAAEVAKLKAVRTTSAGHIELDPEKVGIVNAILDIPTPALD